MNEEQYQTLGSPPLESQDVGFQLRTASGALMPGIGFLTCDLCIGGEMYKQQFIVCQQLTPGIILGRDFLSRNQLWNYMGTRRNIAIERRTRPISTNSRRDD